MLSLRAQRLGCVVLLTKHQPCITQTHRNWSNTDGKLRTWYYFIPATFENNYFTNQSTIPSNDWVFEMVECKSIAHMMPRVCSLWISKNLQAWGRNLHTPAPPRISILCCHVMHIQKPAKMNMDTWSHIWTSKARRPRLRNSTHAQPHKGTHKRNPGAPGPQVFRLEALRALACIPSGSSFSMRSAMATGMSWLGVQAGLSIGPTSLGRIFARFVRSKPSEQLSWLICVLQLYFSAHCLNLSRLSLKLSKKHKKSRYLPFVLRQLKNKILVCLLRDSLRDGQPIGFIEYQDFKCKLDFFVLRRYFLQKSHFYWF